MDTSRAALFEENTALKAALAAAQTKGLEVVAELAVARAKASEDLALIAQQKLRIAKLEHQIYGQRSERSVRLIDQLPLTFEELESSATQDELAAEQATAKVTNVAGFKVLAWIADHPRWTFHFTPTSASWLNAVEGFFSTITRGKLTGRLQIRR